MKKIIAIVTLLIGVLSLSSCEKSPEDEWERFYGYTKADIIGHYEAIVGEEYYPDLPTEGVTVYPTASIDIIEQGENQNLVRLHIVIPDVINKYFSGAINSADYESEMAFSNSSEDILMTVYKNKDNQVRLQGRERRCIHNSDGELLNCILHGFDVVKTEETTTK